MHEKRPSSEIFNCEANRFGRKATARMDSLEHSRVEQADISIFDDGIVNIQAFIRIVDRRGENTCCDDNYRNRHQESASAIGIGR